MTVQAPDELTKGHRRLWLDLQERAGWAAQGLDRLQERAADHAQRAADGLRLELDHEDAREQLIEAQRLLELYADMDEAELGWPVPEELERPGWEHVQAQPDHRELKFPVPPSGLMQVGEPKAAEPEELDTILVVPQLHHHVVAGSPPERWHLALGWNVQHRLAVYFSWRCGP